MSSSTPPPAFVSRGGDKLSAALDHFGIDATGLVCADLGSHVGGFVDCIEQPARLRLQFPLAGAVAITVTFVLFDPLGGGRQIRHGSVLPCEVSGHPIDDRLISDSSKRPV